MPISSFPISVNASVNLSDINIDTDLDMGVNSIVGYTPTTSLNDEIKLLSNDGKELHDFNTTTIISVNDDTEYSTTAITGTPYVVATYTALKKGYVIGKLKAELKNTSSTYPSNMAFRVNGSALTNPILITHNSSTYTEKTETIILPSLINVGDTITLVAYTGNAISPTFRKLVRAELIQISEVKDLIGTITFSF